MEQSLIGQTAVVTGAGGALGRAVAIALAQCGAKVSCGDLNFGAAQDTAKRILSAGYSASAFEVDVADELAVARWHEAVVDKYGPASIVANVAGVIDRRLLDELDFTGFMEVVGVNLGGPFLVAKNFFKDLISHPWGRIVNVASVAGLNGYPFPAYAASKAGVINLTRSLLTDFWGTSVTVNAVCPGAMDTAMFNTQLIPKIAKRTPIGRIVTVSEVASMVAFLSGPGSSGINGAAIPVDGGESAIFQYFDN